VAVFDWTNADGGDWSTRTNWAPLTGAPPGTQDEGIFGSLATSYTVTVTTTVVDVAIGIIAPGASGPTFSISGSLTTQDIFYLGLSPTSMTVEAGGLLDVTNTLEAIGVTETITIAGAGAGGHLVLGDPLLIGAAGSNVTFDFANTSPTTLNAGVIQIDNTNRLPGGDPTTQTITDVANGDRFILPDENFLAGDTVTLNTTTHVLTVKQGLIPVFTMDNIFLQTGATNAFAIVNGNTIEAVCYARGTRIRTPDGEQPVEKLRAGKQVITLVDGQEIPQTVTWLGHRRISLAGHPRPETVAPIRIRRDAITDGMPYRDLIVSPDHAIFVDGKLICARQLVNGSTTRQELDWTAVDYYHVELDQHAILIAEGLPAESYIDTGNRGFFANSGAPLVLHPDLTDESDYPTREAGSCVPFVSDETGVRPVWQKLADRAVALGQPVSQHGTTTDAGLRLLADRRTVRPVVSDSDRTIFVLPRGASEVRLLSRAQSPTEARPWLDDRRRLGVCVKRIVLRGADELREIPVDHPDLSRGWWAVERDGQLMSRWTNGEAVLPLPEMSGHVMLEIHLAGSIIYTVDVATEDGAQQRVAA
jgi:Hint domain